jgi:hypothetical protein
LTSIPGESTGRHPGPLTVMVAVDVSFFATQFAARIQRNIVAKLPMLKRLLAPDFPLARAEGVKPKPTEAWHEGGTAHEGR